MQQNYEYILFDFRFASSWFHAAGRVVWKDTAKLLALFRSSAVKKSPRGATEIFYKLQFAEFKVTTAVN